MLKLSGLFFFVTFTLFSGNALAGDHDLAGPLRTTWCASLLLSHPDGQDGNRGDFHYHLRNMSGVAVTAARELAIRPLTFKEQLGKLSSAIDRTVFNFVDFSNLFKSSLDYTQPHDSEAHLTLLDPKNIPWSYRNKLHGEKLTGRLLQLENDFTDESAKSISFAFSIHGAREIKTYQAQIIEQALTLEHKMGPQPDDQPLWSAYGATHLGLGVFSAYVIPDSLLKIIATLENPTLAAVPGAVLSAASIRFFYLPFFRRSVSYLAGKFGPRLRDRDEDFYDPQRIGILDPAPQFNKMLKRRQELPDSFIFASYTATLTPELTAELLEATRTNRDVDLEALKAAVAFARKNEVEDVNKFYLLIDQMYFWDQETLEPALVTFVRIKRSLVSAPKARRPRLERMSVPRWQDSLVPGLAK